MVENTFKIHAGGGEVEQDHKRRNGFSYFIVVSSCLMSETATVSTTGRRVRFVVAVVSSCRATSAYPYIAIVSNH